MSPSPRPGHPARKDRTSGRSPRSQDSSNTRSGSVRAPGPDMELCRGTSPMAITTLAQALILIEPEFAGHPVDGPGETLAECSRGAAELSSDLHPLTSLRAKVREPSLLVREPAPESIQQLSPDREAAGARFGRRDRQHVFVEADLATVVAPLRLLPAGLLCHFIPGHRQEQGQQPLGAVQLKLARGRTHEEALEYRLTEV